MNKIFSTLIFTFFSFQVLAGANLEDEVACYKALISKANGANYLLAGDIVIIPLIEKGEVSLYAFTNDHAYRFKLPKEQNKVAVKKRKKLIGDDGKDFRYYYFALEMPDKLPVYISYTHKSHRPLNPGIGWRDKPVKSYKVQTLNGGAYLNDDTRKVFHDELRKRIETVSETYESQKEFMRTDENPDEYKSALELCSKVEEVKSDANAELAEFPVPQQDGQGGQRKGSATTAQ